MVPGQERFYCTGLKSQTGHDEAKLIVVPPAAAAFNSTGHRMKR
jgi:hypothetical protein